MNPSYDKLKKFLSQYVQLNAIEWNLLKKFINVSYYKKGDIIQHAGEIQDKIIYLNDGLARSFIIDFNGNDYTWQIHFNDENASVINLLAVDYQSFLQRKESPITIEVLEDCEILWISYETLQILYKFSKKYERLGRLALEEGFSYLQQRFIDLSTKPAQERYEEFIESYSYIFKKVPQYHIASYLRITPQHLSKIKKELKNS